MLQRKTISLALSSRPVQAGALGPVARVHVWCNRTPDKRVKSAKKMEAPAGFD